MKKKILVVFTILGLTNLALNINFISNPVSSAAQKVLTKYRYDHTAEKEAKKLDKKNDQTEAEIKELDKKIATLKKKLGKSTSTSSVSAKKLAELEYNGKDVITVNSNKTNFKEDDLNTKQGAWQEYGNLDQLNRVTSANALLNKSLMPTQKREPLHINPTGWHNKRIANGWLYNRSHLIGYQLTGQNNNIKNLMTGTRQLNDPEMVKYENEVAEYLKESASNYVRYRVTPIFRENELLARGVEMEGQSVSSNRIHFKVYIFNVQPGMILNYKDGTIKVA